MYGKLATCVMALAIIGISAPIVDAEDVFDDFDAYAVGTSISNEPGWEGWDGSFDPATISDAFAYSGTNSVRIDGSSDLVRLLTGFDSGSVDLSAMLYVPTDSTGQHYFILMNQYTSGGNPKDWSVQTVGNLDTEVIAAGYGNTAPVPLVLDEWIEIRMDIDLDANTVDEYLNGQLLSSHQWDNNNHGTLQAIDLYSPGGVVFYDDIRVTSIQSLTWNGPENAAWSSQNWLDADSNPTASTPGEFNRAIITGTTVNVAADAAAWKLDLDSGGIAIDSGQTLAVTYDLNAAAGTTISLGANATLAAAGGTADSITTAGSSSFDIGVASFNVASFDDGGATGTLTKQGDGAMVIRGDLSATAVRVEGGTLQTIGAGALATGGVTEIQLAGGTFSVHNTDSTSVPNSLGEYWFANAPGEDQLDPIATGTGFLTMAPDAVSRLDAGLDFSGAEMNARSGGLFPSANNFGAAWVGSLTIGGDSAMEAGTITFATRSDDGSVMWLDLNQDGVYDSPGELIVDNNGDHSDEVQVGTVTLADGTYNVAFGFYEAGGGENMAARYTYFWPPAPTTDQAVLKNYYDTGMVPMWNGGDIDPTNPAQAGAWTGTLPAGVDATGVAITMTADSGLGAVSGGEVAYGSLSIDAGTLTTAKGATGGYSFQEVTINGDAGFDTEENTSLTAGTVGLSAGGATVTITKTGPADLGLSLPGTGLQHATFDVQEGGLAVLDSSAPLGGAAVDLNGGALVLASSGSDVSVDQPVNVVTDGSILGGAGGIGVAGPLTATYTQNVTVDNGTLTLGSSDDYTLEMAGTINGTGGVAIEQGSVLFSAGGTVSTITVGAGINVTTTGAGVAATDTVLMGNTTYAISGGTIGLAAASPADGTTLALNGTTATISSKAGISLDDMGIGTTDGSYTYDVGTETHTMIASGTDIWGSSDEFHFAYTEMSGDVDIIAHVLNIDDLDAIGTRHAWSKSGVMIRDNMTGGSVYRFIATTGTNGTSAQGRVTANTNAGMNYEAGGGYQAPYWVRLTLDSTTNTINQYRSSDPGDTPADAVNWYLVDTGGEAVTALTGGSYFVGLALTSHDNGNLHTSDIENVFINGLPVGLSAAPGVNQEDTNLLVTADSILTAEGTAPAMFGDLAVESGVSLTVLDAPLLSVDDVVGLGGTVVGNMEVRGALFAGDTPGTLNVQGTVTMADGSSFSATVSGAADYDRLIASDDVDLGTNTALEIPVTAAAPFQAGTYTLIDNSTAETGVIGQFASMTDLGGYAGADPVQYNEYDVKLTIDLNLHPGDADLSTATDLSDFNIWNANKFTSGTGWAAGDFNADGQTDLSDFNIWNANKFTVAGGGAAPAPTQVPEPGTLALLACGLLGLLFAWRRRTM